MSQKKKETKELLILKAKAEGRISRLIIDKDAAMYSYVNGGIPTWLVKIKLTRFKMGADGKPYVDPSTGDVAKEIISEYITELIVTYTPEAEEES